MTELEFRAARQIANRTKRPDTAFSIVVALASVESSMQAARLAQLIDVHRSGISLVAQELEALGVLTRTWSKSERVKKIERVKDRRRGRQRLYSLAPAWHHKISLATPGATDDRFE